MDGHGKQNGVCVEIFEINASRHSVANYNARCYRYKYAE